MRQSCLFCASKHVGQAIVLMMESKQGYPHYRWLAVGHLAEAGDETVTSYPDLAQELRSIRIKLMGQEPGYESTSLETVLKHIRKAAVKDGAQTDEEFLQAIA